MESKHFTLIRKTLAGLFLFFSLSACNYLDVIPPEQATLDDTMNDMDAVRNFLLSCYTEIDFVQHQFNENTTDEFGLSSMFDNDIAYNLLKVNSMQADWERIYNSIGQCNLFLSQLEKSHPLGMTEDVKKQFVAEAKFLIAYFHFVGLEFWGPIPIVDHWMPMDLPVSEIPGRSHFDYVVDFISKKLDEAAIDLPAIRTQDEWGRATSTICYALKSRLLLYAASDLWNGKWPFYNWKNKVYETPGYGKELVSLIYDPQKWQKALEASTRAIEWAENKGGHKLLTIEDMPTRGLSTKLPYVPLKDNDTDFRERVQLFSLLLNSTPAEGNLEYIWGLNKPSIAIDQLQSLPLNIIQRNGAWVSGWSLKAPTLYSIESFYTENGKLPAKDSSFPARKEWLSSANIAQHPDIIKLCVGREPRFYACFAFDGGEYSPCLNQGNSLFIDMKSSSAQGRNPQTNRNFSATGFLFKKFTEPDLEFTATNGERGNNKDYPLPLIRLAELYLNRAECYAALGENDKALADLNKIRERAGIKLLENTDIDSDMTVMDWVRTERFIELFSEQQRYFDARRWMIAPTQFKAGAREGLNVMSKYNPTFEEFNIRTPLDQPYVWDNRMYIWPIPASDVYSNPQMVQSPGY